ncbi:mitochondrial import inner membrane translocase subunit TIM44 [Salminus brasiliensis]|uniref:mitochondrial import inner membrane translocase subunit TIM44 n=1 Tax=Salminus brasiliensis TaxID=930266 RepID=UPI003B8317A9
MAATLCRCRQQNVRRFLLLASRPCFSIYDRSPAHRINGSVTSSSQVRYLWRGDDRRQKSFLWQILDVVKHELGKDNELLKGIKWLIEQLEESARRIQQVKSILKNHFNIGPSGRYRPPTKLRKRSEAIMFDPNQEKTNDVLYKDVMWYPYWKDFKDNSVVFNRLTELMRKYDESIRFFTRPFHAAIDKIMDLKDKSGLFIGCELPAVLTEIMKVDPNFNKDSFLKQCEKDIIPNVLEAIIRGDLEILQDWCYEATYIKLAQSIKQGKEKRLQFHSKVVDISNVQLFGGKMARQGPVLYITFKTQAVIVTCDSKGDMVKGNLKHMRQSIHHWSLCRDQEETNPFAAWRLLDFTVRPPFS